MTNREIRNNTEKNIDNTLENLQTLRDSTGQETQKIINEMITYARNLQGLCFDLSNQEDVYKN